MIYFEIGAVLFILTDSLLVYTCCVSGALQDRMNGDAG